MADEEVNSRKPDCYGDPEKVCPIGERGVIEPNIACLSCEFIKSCLSHALSKRGVLRPSIKEAPVVKKTVGFFRRWSRLKRSKS